jgi:hypothetical protein
MAENQLSILASLHGRYYNALSRDGVSTQFLTFAQKFQRLLDFDLETCCFNGFAAAEEVIPPLLFKRMESIWPATLAAVERGRQLPPTVNHADVHLANWYITQGGAMGLTDWSATCINHWSRDFAYAVATSLSVQNRRRWERDLLKFYLDQMRAAGGPPLNYNDAWRDYRQQLSAALAYWTITLQPSSKMPEFQPRDLTLEFIGRLTKAMQDLDTLDIQ